MNNNLFLFSIGPVKNFISESRKAQDLFASSALLSNLCKKAIIIANEKFKDYNFELITPAIKLTILKSSEFPSIPNRFLAAIKGDAEKLKAIAKGIEDDIKKDFCEIIFDDSKLELHDEAVEQLENHLDIRWVFTAYKDDNYNIAYTTVNKQLAAIKNYKPLSKLNELGRKCIVDGKLNVKFYRETKNGEIDINKKNKLYQAKNAVEIIRSGDESILEIWQLQKGEGISAVTLKKRLYQKESHQFPSTAAIALMHVFEELKNNKAFIKFKNKVQGTTDSNGTLVKKYFTHSNDQLFYKENIKPLFKREEKPEVKLNTCLKEHEDWSDSDKLQSPMSKYYAFIRFDGDNFGNWFSGVFKKDTVSLKDYQMKLSGLLIAFADKMKQDITTPKGRVIYAGGEDFMAMINLHYLKESVSEIREQFKLMVSDPMQKFIKVPTALTLSMGICIAHYLEPLQLVLDKTAKMEKRAKSNGRNGFAIRISKHSGSQIETHLHWNTDGINNTFNDIYEIISEILNKNTSPAFLLNIYNYCDEMDFQDSAKKVIVSKMKLFIDRAIEIKGNGKKKVFDLLHIKLEQFLYSSHSIKSFANLLLTIDFIQRHDYIKP